MLAAAHRRVTSLSRRRVCQSIQRLPVSRTSFTLFSVLRMARKTHKNRVNTARFTGQGITNALLCVCLSMCVGNTLSYATYATALTVYMFSIPTVGHAAIPHGLVSRIVIYFDCCVYSISLRT